MSRTGSPPSPVTNSAHRVASWISFVYGATTTTGHPATRISAAVAASPAYSYALTCSSYHGPPRRPAGSPPAPITAPANPPYTISLPRTAAGGDTRAATTPAAAALPDPGGPA